MTTYSGINGFNTRILGGISRDNVEAAQERVGGAVMLAMDDPELSRWMHNNGGISIYRQTGDAPENGPLDHTAAEFMTERIKNGAGSDYIGFYNELDPSPLMLQRTMECMEICVQAHQKGVILNLATNKSKAQWEMCVPAIQRADELGFGVGAHFYPDNANDLGGEAFLDIKHAFPNVFWIFTEFNYLQSINNATRGWRGTNLDRSAFIKKWNAFMIQENMPACWFPYDFWDQPTVEEAKAHGLGYNDLPDVIETFSSQNKTCIFKGLNMTPIPSPVPQLTSATVTATADPSGANIRASFTTSSAILGKLHVGDPVMYSPMAVPGGVYSVGSAIRHDWLALGQGYVATGVVTLKDAPNTPVTTETLIDVSQYQGVINWPVVVDSDLPPDVKFAYIRATIGTNGLDTQFVTNAKGATAAGLPVSFYHVFRPEQDGAAQAQAFVQQTRPYAHSEPLAVDVEIDGSDVGKPQSPSALADRLLAFVQVMKSITGEYPAIYTGNWFWSPHVGSAHDAVFGLCPLWLAEYGPVGQPPIEPTKIPHGWRTWSIHQYSSSGSIQGINARVDMDRLKP